MNAEEFIVGVARSSIEHYFEHRKFIDYRKFLKDAPEEFLVRAGAFVTLMKRGELRGCIGTYLPVYENVVDEVIHNAVAAAFEDPRFPPLERSELEEVDISVDVLSPPERVHDLSELDPKKYGIILKKGWKSGLLLPDLDGVDTVEEQIRITMMKAGLFSLDGVEIYRFEVKRYGKKK